MIRTGDCDHYHYDLTTGFQVVWIPKLQRSKKSCFLWLRLEKVCCPKSTIFGASSLKLKTWKFLSCFFVCGVLPENLSWLKGAEVEIPSLKVFKKKLFPSHQEISRKMVSETTSSISEGVLLLKIYTASASVVQPAHLLHQFLQKILWGGILQVKAPWFGFISNCFQWLGFYKGKKYRAWVKLPALITSQSASWKMSFFFRFRCVIQSCSHTCYTYSTDVYHFLVYVHMWFWILETKSC